MTILKAIVDFLVSVLADIFGGIVNGIGELLNRAPDHGFHDELKKPEELLSSGAKGIAIGQKQLSLDTSFSGGLLVSGMPGSGKSVAIVANTGLLADASFVFYDPSRTLLPVLGPYLKHKRGYDRIAVLDFTNPEISEGFNPLSRVHTSSDAQTIANLLLEPLTRGSKDKFWGLEGASILTLLIDILLSQAEDYHNPYNLALLVNEVSGSRDKLDRMVVRCKHPTVFSRYKAMIAGMKSENTLSSLLATIRASTSTFLNEDVAKVTATDTLGDLTHILRKQRTALFIQIPTLDVDRVAGITSIFISQLYRSILGTMPEKRDQNILLVLDDFSTLSGLLREAILFGSNCRKYRASQVICMQNISQLYAVDRGLTDALKGSMNRLTFGNMPLDEAKEISQLLGQYSYEDPKGIERNRVLKTPTELRNLKQWEAVLQVGSKSSIVEATPYFKTWRFRNIDSLPPLILERQFPAGPIPVLPMP